MGIKCLHANTQHIGGPFDLVYGIQENVITSLHCTGLTYSFRDCKMQRKTKQNPQGDVFMWRGQIYSPTTQLLAQVPLQLQTLRSLPCQSLWILFVSKVTRARAELPVFISTAYLYSSFRHVQIFYIWCIVKRTVVPLGIFKHFFNLSGVSAYSELEEMQRNVAEQNK